MRIACVGGGPAGLTFALLMKQRHPTYEVVVIERDPQESRTGWGVTFGDDIVDALRSVCGPVADDVESTASGWSGEVVDLAGVRSDVHPSHGFTIGRGALLDILARHAGLAGVEIVRGVRVTSDDLPDADLVVAADGVNSALRESRAADFGPTTVTGTNRYVWLGTPKVFDEFTFTFVETPAGWVWSYAYGYDAGTSTFIVECSAATWRALGLDSMPADESLRYLGTLFEDALKGAPLLALSADADRLPWTRFGTLACEHWSSGRMVLMGDAAHTAHFSIGSGTKLAIGDAVALARALDRTSDVALALDTYERERRAEIARTVNDARLSREWFEHVPRYLGADVERFASLMHDRKSPLLPRMPVGAYFFLHRQSQENPVLRRARDVVGTAVQEVLARRARA